MAMTFEEYPNYIPRNYKPKSARQLESYDQEGVRTSETKYTRKSVSKLKKNPRSTQVNVNLLVLLTAINMAPFADDDDKTGKKQARMFQMRRN